MNDDDDDNSGSQNGTEWYFDADGDSAYSANLRQANFPSQKPDPAAPGDTTKTGGPDTTQWNRPTVYVKNSHIRIGLRLGDKARSGATTGQVGVGYPITDYPIRLAPVFKTKTMSGGNQTATTNVLNVSPSQGPYTLSVKDIPENAAAKLANTVGFEAESIEFRFMYNALGESYVDANGNGQHDAGEQIVNDRDGDGEVDEDWKAVPGKHVTSHLIYRLAGDPTALALVQATDNVGAGINAIFVKIADFTCQWGQAAGAVTTADVWAAIWHTNNFWTPIAAGPPPHPDNASGFHGTGDPVEADRADKWTNKPKCYTYDHDAGVEETVDYALDNNVTRCGGWAKLLTAFAGGHNKPVRPIQVSPRWLRDRGGVRTAVDPTAGGWAVGDIAHMPNWIDVPPVPIYLRVGNIDGQANPHGGGFLGTAFNLHRVTWSDDDGNGSHNGVERIYDASYDHQAAVAGGRAQAGWQSFHGYEEDAFVSYIYGMRCRVVAVDGAGNITHVDTVTEDVTVANNVGLTEIYVFPWP